MNFRRKKYLPFLIKKNLNEKLRVHLIIYTKYLNTMALLVVLTHT